MLAWMIWTLGLLLLLAPAYAVHSLAGVMLASGATARVPAAGPASRAAPGPSPRSGTWLDRVRWLNVRPLTPADLDDRVVIVEFWSFDCINCRRTVPAMRALQRRFARAADVRIVGVHTPELERERDTTAVRAAIARLGIAFAVAHDPNEAAWNAFGDHCWPSLYLLDRHGEIRWRHIGELHEGTASWQELLDAVARLRSDARS